MPYERTVAAHLCALAATGTILACAAFGCASGLSNAETAEDSGLLQDSSSFGDALLDAAVDVPVNEAALDARGDAIADDGDGAGMDTGRGGECVDGGAMAPGLTTLAAGTRPMVCVVDACNVYWTDQATGGVMRVSKNGGSVSTIATSTPPQGQSMMSEGLAIDANNLYWSEYVSTAPADGGVPLGTGDVMQTNLVGNTSTKIWSGAHGPSAVAVDPNDVYVLQGTDLERVPIGGGMVTTLATGAGAYGLTVTPSAVFWTPYNGVDAVFTVPLDGGAASTFTKGQWPPDAGASSTVVAQDGTSLYSGDTKPGGGSGSVYARPLDGGTQTVLSGAAEPLGIAYDSSNIYVTTGQGGTVLEIAKSGASVKTLASGQGWPMGIAVDDAFVYWVNNNGGANSVMRIAK